MNKRSFITCLLIFGLIFTMATVIGCGGGSGDSSGALTSSVPVDSSPVASATPTPSPSSTSSTDGSVSGRIIDENGSGVEGAIVTVYIEILGAPEVVSMAYSDDQGKYAITNLSQGTDYKMIVTTTGRTNISTSFNLDNSDPDLILLITQPVGVGTVVFNVEKPVVLGTPVQAASGYDFTWSESAYSDTVFQKYELRRSDSQDVFPGDLAKTVSTKTVLNANDVPPSEDVDYYYRIFEVIRPTGLDGEVLIGSNVVSTKQDSTPTPTPTSTLTPSPETRKWTVLVYLDADNTLQNGGYDLRNFNQMEQIGSDSNVNIVVQWDRRSRTTAVNWSGCRRYYVTKDESSSDSINSTLIENMGSVNSGSPDTLKNFILWGETNYPAEKYSVILWNHGGGWRTISKTASSRSICWDDTSGDSISEAELIGVFQSLTASTGKKIECLGMDACLMGMTEVAYDLRNYANYMVFSEASEPSRGWDYSLVLGDLQGTPSMNGSDFATAIVNRYSQVYSSSSGVTLSAVDASKMANVASAVNSFCDTASSLMSSQKSFFLYLISTAFQVDSSYTDYRDIGDFCNVVTTFSLNSNLVTKATNLKNAVDAAVIAEFHSSDFSRCSGLSIWLPTATNFNVYKNVYSSISFGADTGWDEFLNSALN